MGWWVSEVFYEINKFHPKLKKRNLRIKHIPGFISAEINPVSVPSLLLEQKHGMKNCSSVTFALSEFIRQPDSTKHFVDDALELIIKSEEKDLSPWSELRTLWQIRGCFKFNSEFPSAIFILIRIKKALWKQSGLLTSDRLQGVRTSTITPGLKDSRAQQKSMRLQVFSLQAARFLLSSLFLLLA